jgi:hypothetical protein
MPNLTIEDSVLIVNDTVTVTAETFNNCPEVSTTQYDTSRTAVFCEYNYYAYEVGLIKTVRILPAEDSHTDELTGYSDRSKRQKTAELFTLPKLSQSIQSINYDILLSPKNKYGYNQSL